MISHHKLIWGWLRLILGVAQMTLAAASVGALWVVGLHGVTWVFLAGATLALVVSRRLYGGRPDPELERRPGDEGEPVKGRPKKTN